MMNSNDIDKMNTLLIAGSNGFIGSSLYTHFEKDYNTIGISKKKSSSSFRVNLENIDEIDSFFEKGNRIKNIIFLVGRAHKKGKKSEFDKYEKTNFFTIKNLLKSLEKNNKIPDKIIFASTISVYGERLNRFIYNEYLKLKPKSPYAITKLKAEEYLLKNYPDITWVLRFSPVYSPYFKLNIDRRTKIKNFYFRIGNGKSKFSLCSINNIKTVCDAILDGSIPPDIYNLSDPNNYDYNFLLKKQKANLFIPIPVFLIKLLYLYGKYSKNTFIKENSIKLLTDNIYPSTKLNKFIQLSSDFKN